VGRWCARAALASLGFARTIPARDESGRPVWPAGVVGSITHTAGCARAAVASRSVARAVGVDSERVLSPSRARLVADTIATESEIAAGVNAGLDRSEALTLAFSAKESLFKCLHQLVTWRFGFEDARLVRVDGSDRRFSLQIETTLSADFPAGTTLTGRFAVESAVLHTGLLLRADAIPQTT
jgi:enterobactin synthetase component D